LELKPIVFWAGALIATLALALALHIPQRMNCSGVGRHMSCEHSLLDPAVWTRR
jgi:hypothetical protein